MSQGDSERLDRIAAILTLANRSAIAEAKRDIRKDELNVAILDACSSEWVPAGEIWGKFQKKNQAIPSHLRAPGCGACG